MLTPKQVIRAGANLHLDCSKFDAIRETVNRLRTLENIKSGLYLARDTFNILSEMHRIGQRQFHWQRSCSICRSSTATFSFTAKDNAPSTSNSSTVSLHLTLR